MQRYRFAVEYLGTRYAGWQLQSNAPTVQGELEKALGTALGLPVSVVGAGRTDAGVHAQGQAAHFDCGRPFNPARLERSVNGLTPGDICIRGLESCRADFHARYSALSRRYRYVIALRPTALYAHISWFPGKAPDAHLFREEFGQVVGSHNFSRFCVSRGDGKSEHCTVVRADCETDGPFLLARIEADRFLHKMVRAIVGACFEVARGKLPPGTVSSILRGEHAGEWLWAPPVGLCLERVTYPDYEIQIRP